MTLTLTFALSGVAIIALIFAKRTEEQKGRAFLILRLISRGDRRVREISHNLIMSYDKEKERLIFLTKKQLPVRTKVTWNKFSSSLSEFGHQYLHKLRDTKLLKSNSSGISEFFGKLNETKEDSGEIENSIERGFQNDNEKVE